MDLETIILLGSAFGIGTVIPKVTEAVIDRVKNRDADERDAWKRLDKEAHQRRVIQERFHRHRQTCHYRHRALDGSVVDFCQMPPGPDDPIEGA